LAFKNGELGVERIDALNALGFVWDVFEENWIQNVEAFKAFVEENGHARVPQRFVTGDGVKLGSWVSNQRTAFKKGELEVERIDALNELDFIWGAKNKK
jgi:hypothetical protein